MENEANEQQLLTLDIIQVYTKVLFLPGKSIQFGLALHTYICVRYSRTENDKLSIYITKTQA